MKKINIYRKHKINLNPNSILEYFIIFIFLTIFGTLTHEFAHYVVALKLDMEPTFHFSSVTYNKRINPIGLDYKTGRNFFLSTAAGPIQTIFTGLVGFTMLIFIRINKFKVSNFTYNISIFLSLFWLRPCFNLLIILVKSIFQKKLVTFGDEVLLSYYLGFNSLLINMCSGVIGLIICYITVFKFFSIKERLNLIIGGFFGSVVGYFLWFYIFGKILLP